MEEKIIVTIGREYGSGGRDVGVKLANELGIKFVDQELINRASQGTGLHEEYVRENEEKAPSFSLGAMFTGIDSFANNPADQIQAKQFDIIREIAEEGSCVIVGRAADYVLRGMTHASIFIFAPMEKRIERIRNNTQAYKLLDPGRKYTDAELEKIIKSMDKQRSRYYEFYTDSKWGSRDGYDLLIDTSRTGIDGAVKIIDTYIRECRGKDITSDL